MMFCRRSLRNGRVRSIRGCFKVLVTKRKVKRFHKQQSRNVPLSGCVGTFWADLDVLGHSEQVEIY